MQNYPLHYSVSPLLSSDRIQVWDAAKKTVLLIPAADDAMKNGQAPYPVYSDKEKTRLAWLIQAAKVTTGADKDETTTVYTISNVRGDVLGKVAQKDGGWEVQAANGAALAQIKEKGAEQSCLGCLLSILDIFELLFFFIAPHRYEVQVNAQPALKLQQADYKLSDSYKLTSAGEFFQADETLLLLSLAAVLLD